MHNTPFHHHPLAVWIVLGYSKLADKLSICISACVSSEGCKGAVVGVRECIHHCIDGRLHLPMSRVSVADAVQAYLVCAGGMGRRSGRLVTILREHIFDFRPARRVRGGKGAIAS